MIKNSLLLVSIMILTGCHSIGPKVLNNDRFHYNQAMGNSNNQELLLNMVRLRYDENPTLLKVGNISGSTNIQGGAGIGGQLFKQSYNSFLASSTNIAYTDNPIISYTPLDDQHFTHAFLSSLKLADIGLLLQSSWSVARVMRVSLQRVGNAVNAESAARSTSSHIPKYQNFLDMTYVLRRIQLNDALTGFYSKKGNVEELTLIIKPGYRLTPKDRTILRTAGIDIYHNKIILSNYPGPHKVYVVTRSLLGVLNYLSKGMDVPPEDAARKVLTQTVYPDGKVFNWRLVLNGMMHIYYSNEPPVDALVAVPHRGRWYYIKDTDSDSKQTLILLSNISGLIQAVPAGGRSSPALARTV